jgi:DNA-binding NarL/FixJ family response regulator
MDPARPRVLVVDDYDAVLARVGAVLCDEFIVIGVHDMSSLMRIWEGAQADVIVLDVALAVGTGFEAAARLRAAGCDAPIVFLSVHEEADVVAAGWAAGAVGYVAKRDLDRSLGPAVRAAMRGRRYVSPAIACVAHGEEPS